MISSVAGAADFTIQIKSAEKKSSVYRLSDNLKVGSLVSTLAGFALQLPSGDVLNQGLAPMYFRSSNCSGPAYTSLNNNYAKGSLAYMKPIPSEPSSLYKIGGYGGAKYTGVISSNSSVGCEFQSVTDSLDVPVSSANLSLGDHSFLSEEQGANFLDSLLFRTQFE